MADGLKYIFEYTTEDGELYYLRGVITADEVDQRSTEELLAVHFAPWLISLKQAMTEKSG